MANQKNIDILNFDTIDSNYDLRYNDAFNTRFELLRPLNNVKKLYLKSIEMPINFYNIRNNSNMCKFTIKDNNNVTYTVNIPEGNYTTITSLLTALNNAFANVISNTTIQFVLYNTNYIRLSATSTTITGLTITETILSRYVLGFNNNATTSGLTITAKTPYLLNVDNYINIYFANVPTENAGLKNCHFKIPLNATNGQILYLAENTAYNQSILLLSNQHISYLNVQIYDRFNCQILGNNSDYSFSVGVEYNDPIDQNYFQNC